MTNFKKYYNKKKVLITGHTGFKGSWLSLWLSYVGAKVYGISNNIPSNPSNFKAIGLRKKINHNIIDIRNLEKLKKTISRIKPDFIFHLAAQSLVKKSITNPIETFSSNSIGTMNILESLKVLKNKCSVIIITSDKSYRNIEVNRGYKEDDELGGHDPYSASKGAAELIIRSYYKSYFINKKNIRIGVARAGNVIGGGDWSENRLIPDCIKAWSKGKKVIIRNPKSTRPWQHVLEIINGYLTFGYKLNTNLKLNGEVFNFGPKDSQNRDVLTLVKEMKKNWPLVSWKLKKNKYDLESKLLKLNSNKAEKLLQWSTKLSFSETISMTINWYKKFYKDKDVIKESLKQIQKFEVKL
tara:strand:- start:249 stop:1310 length:1062 start_codon:yes stop_codon:yes gene_type:complete